MVRGMVRGEILIGRDVNLGQQDETLQDCSAQWPRVSVSIFGEGDVGSKTEMPADMWFIRLFQTGLYELDAQRRH